MSQLSLFSAAAREPRLDDVDGLLAGPGQVVRRTGAARLSVVVDDGWRVSGLVAELAVLGLEAEIEPAEPDSVTVRTPWLVELLPVADAWTPAPDTPWDTRFEETGEYPETEALYLTPNGQSTLLSRAWHHLLIGLNSDASGWYPWTPRTRHRNTVLETSRELSGDVTIRGRWHLLGRLDGAWVIWKS